MKTSFLIFLTTALLLHLNIAAQYAPPAGQAGTTAIHKDSSLIVSWAVNCSVKRGWQNAADTSLGKASVGDSAMATGQANASVVSLGDGGTAVLMFERPLYDGPAWDFAVFENSFDDFFLELARVSVSSDGLNYFDFPAHSLTDTASQVTAFDSLDATLLNNLAGKYRGMYGTPFDLSEMAGISGLDVGNIISVKLTDVVGSILPSFGSYDTSGRLINDPWPTPFPSSGFDLDAVAAIHMIPASIGESESALFCVYPNPAVSVICVIPDESYRQNFSVEITGIDGKLIRQERNTSGNSLHIDVRSLPEGFYFLHFFSRDKHCTRTITIAR